MDFAFTEDQQTIREAVLQHCSQFTDDYWLDTGRPDLYLDANLDVVAGRRRFDHCDAVHSTASVAPDAVSGTTFDAPERLTERAVEGPSRSRDMHVGQRWAPGPGPPRQ